MRTTTVTPGASLSLLEYTVGKASSTCVYPGIAQCFAIAGWKPSGMLCAHVSPGATGEELDAVFAALDGMGGSSATTWYVLGPFNDHFTAPGAQWRSTRHIAKAFNAALGKKSTADRFILDVTAERHRQVLEEGFDIPRTFSSIDIRAEHRGWDSMIVFSYKEGSHRVKDWTRLRWDRFVRF
jgi:hypothetical protein